MTPIQNRPIAPIVIQCYGEKYGNAFNQSN